MIAGDVITDAHRKIGVAAIDEPLNADQIASGLRAMNRLLRSFQNREPDLWLVSSEDIGLSQQAEYDIGTCQPRAIRSARLVRAGVETPMQQMTRQEYDDLPIKNTTGMPTTFYFDRQRCNGTIYVWPVLSSGTATFRMTYEREIKASKQVGDKVDLPSEWEEALCKSAFLDHFPKG